MVIYAPKPRPVASGFWTFCDQTGDLRHVDAHADSTVCTRWPLLDRWHRNLIERGVDWLLNAAGAGRERLDQALRHAYPGSRRQALPPIQSAFWHRLLIGQSGGATAQLYLGNGQAESSGGLVVSDSKDGNVVTGHGGGAKPANTEEQVVLVVGPERSRRGIDRHECSRRWWRRWWLCRSRDRRIGRLVTGWWRRWPCGAPWMGMSSDCSKLIYGRESRTGWRRR